MVSFPIQAPVSALPRVVFADDESRYLVEMIELLRAAGFRCECFEDGASAEAELARGDVDVLVADIYMPGNENLELVAHAKSLRAGPAVILMTGFPTLETAIHSVRLKIDAYLVKPFGFYELLAEVRRVLGSGTKAVSAAQPGSPEAPAASRDSSPPASARVKRAVPLEELALLSKREQEVLAALLQGQDVVTIGGQFRISQHTVRNHLKGIYKKLGVRSRVELILRYTNAAEGTEVGVCQASLLRVKRAGA